MSEVSKPHSELRADVARERERRHWTIDQWRKVDPDWPGGMARCRQDADDAVDSLFEQYQAARKALERIAWSVGPDEYERGELLPHVRIARDALNPASRSES